MTREYGLDETFAVFVKGSCAIALIIGTVFVMSILLKRTVGDNIEHCIEKQLNELSQTQEVSQGTLEVIWKECKALYKEDNL